MSGQDSEKEFFKRDFTIKGRVLFPNLLKPEPTRSGRLVYNCQFIWKDDDPANAQVMQAMQQFLQEAKQRYGAQIPDMYWVYPIKHFNTYMRQDGKPNAEYLRGHYWVNASTGADYPPTVLDQRDLNTRLMAGVHDAEVYSGRNAAINISFYRISKDKHGITVNVRGLVLLSGGDLVQGAASFDAQSVFGQFAAQMGMSPQGGMPPAGAPANPPAPSAPQGWSGQAPANPPAPSAPQGWPGQAPTTPPPANPPAPSAPQGWPGQPPQGNYAPPAGAPPTGTGPSFPPNAGGGYAPPASPSNNTQTHNYYGAPAWPPVNQ